MINCICEYGKNLSDSHKKCPYCGIDLAPLLHINSLLLNIFNNGIKLRDIGRKDEAIDYFIATIILDPSYIDAYLKLTQIFIEKEQINRALLYLDRGLIKNPDNSQLLERKLYIQTQNNKKCDNPSKFLKDISNQPLNNSTNNGEILDQINNSNCIIDNSIKKFKSTKKKTKKV